MQKITVDLIRLAVSGAVICAAVGAAELRGLHHSDQLANAKIRVAPPIQVKAISVGAPAMCWTMNEPDWRSAMQEAQTEPQRLCKPARASRRRCAAIASRPQPQSLLAFAP